MHKRYRGIRGKMTDAYRQTDIVDDSTDIELNCYSLEIMEKFCYLGGTFGGAITRIRSGWSNFRDLVPFVS